MKRQARRPPLEKRDLPNSYDGQKVVDTFTASVSRGEPIALMGRNRTGKTTLLKSLLRNATGYIDDAEREFPVDTGTVAWAHAVAACSFPQDQTASITHGMSPIA